MIRARLKLTALFGAALIAMAVVFGLSGSAARSAGAYSAVGRQALADADLSLRIVMQFAGHSSLLMHDTAGNDILVPHIHNQHENKPKNNDDDEHTRKEQNTTNDVRT